MKEKAILIITDEENVAGNYVRVFLKDNGYRAVYCTHSEFLEYINNIGQPKAVFLVIDHFNIGTRILYQKLRNLHPKTPTIFLKDWGLALEIEETDVVKIFVKYRDRLSQCLEVLISMCRNAV